MPTLTPDEFQIHVVDSLARLDTKITSLIGNGQPGRVTRLESAVEELKKARWIVGGIIIGVSAIIHFVFKY
jgi:hypothetical protein